MRSDGGASAIGTLSGLTVEQRLDAVSGVADPRKLENLADEGPFEDLVGGYKEVEGAPFVDAIRWYTDATKAKKVFEIEYTRTGPHATSVVRRVYQADGVTVKKVATDTITRAGAFETSRTRVIT